MRLAFCSNCEKVSYGGRYHSEICPFCRSKTVTVKVGISPLYVTGILLVAITGIGIYLYEPLELWQRGLIMIAALAAGYALVIKGRSDMRSRALEEGRLGRG